MKKYNKNTESSYFRYWDVNNLYGWAMSQRLPGNGGKWVENTSQFNKDFIKVMKDIFLYNILKIYMTFPMVYSFYLK